MTPVHLGRCHSVAIRRALVVLITLNLIKYFTLTVMCQTNPKLTRLFEANLRLANRHGEQKNYSLAIGLPKSLGAISDAFRLRLASNAERNDPTNEARFCIWNCDSQNTTNLLLFTKYGTRDVPEIIATKYSKSTDVARSDFDPSLPTILIIHGFRGSSISQQTWAVDLKDLILFRQKANVLYADWSHHARVFNYFHALESTPEVAQDIYDILDLFQAAFPEFNRSKMHVIGHSLGAHIAGLLGQMLGGSLDQITALDPTGFYLNSNDGRTKLSVNDASYVVAYHTDTKFLGTNMNIADRDVYINGGDFQPACDRIGVPAIPNGCRHRQATKYVIAFMGKCVMVAYACSDFDSFSRGECGFCRQDSDECVGVGFEWQYELSARVGSLRPSNLSKTKPSNEVPWTRGSADTRYFVSVGPESPQCIYTYQVVVKLDDNANLGPDVVISVLLRLSNNDPNGFRLAITNRLPPFGRVQVFRGERVGSSKFVNGTNVFTGLALIDKSYGLYPALPAKFGSAVLSDRLIDSHPKVYVNFMSHNRFEERAARSGQVKVEHEPQLD